MRSKKIISIVALAGLAGVVYFVAAPMFEQQPQQQMQNVQEVEAVVLHKKEVPVKRELPGRTNAFKVAEIRPQVSGIITERLFEEGSMVEKGDQLYQIDPTSYQAAFDSAQADLEKAQAQSDRYAELIKIDAISKQSYDDAVASLAQAKSQLAIAKVDLDYTKVYAPISGYIGKSNVTQGALVTNGQANELAIITQLDPIYVDMTLPGKDLFEIRTQFNKEMNAVSLTGAAGKYTYPHQGKLQFSEVNVDETTGTVQLRAIFPNPEGELLPGMFVRSTVHLKPMEGFLVPHRAAVRQPNGDLVVWLVNNEGKVNPQPISAEKSIGSNWLVTSGLEDGATIVTKGHMKIQPGMTVKVVLAQAKESK